MNTPTRRLAGLTAKRNGQNFENIFHAACYRQGMAVTRIPDGCRQVGPTKLLRVKTPFDWVVSYKDHTALIDTKTINAGTVGNASVVEHQVIDMLRHEIQGTKAGYVIWLRKLERVLFIPASILHKALGIRGSIAPTVDGAVDLGSIQDLDPRKIFKEIT